MSKQELLDALKSEQSMAEYLEVRDDREIISDIRSVLPPSLTKREYFAAAALTGLLAANATYNGSTSARTQLAQDALAHADALIAASNTGGHHG